METSACDFIVGFRLEEKAINHRPISLATIERSHKVTNAPINHHPFPRSRWTSFDASCVGNVAISARYGFERVCSHQPSPQRLGCKPFRSYPSLSDERKSHPCPHPVKYGRPGRTLSISGLVIPSTSQRGANSHVQGGPRNRVNRDSPRLQSCAC